MKLRKTGLFATAVALVALIGTPAWAGWGDPGRGRYRVRPGDTVNHVDHHGHRGHAHARDGYRHQNVHHDGYGHRGGGFHRDGYCPKPRRFARGYRRGYDSAYADAAYQCEPCNHRFGSRRAFHDHLHHTHRVPFWKIPFVIVHSALGWIFYG